MNGYNDSSREDEKLAHYTHIRIYFEEEVHQKPKKFNLIKQVVDHANIWAPLFCLLEIIMKDNPRIRSIIDVGCGTGGILRTIAKRYPHCPEMIGIDFATDVLLSAQANTPSQGQISFMNADLLHLPFPPRKFDVTVCVNVLHHLHPDDIPRALTELTRVTDKYLIVEIRNKNTIYNFGYLPLVLTLFYRNLPIFPLSLHEIQMLLDQRQFQQQHVRGLVPFSWGCRSLVLLYKRIDIATTH